jgi:hypothetical protein
VPERITGLAVALGAAEFPAMAGAAAVRKFDPLSLFMIIPFACRQSRA